jgi:hypothetical protein
MFRLLFLLLLIPPAYGAEMQLTRTDASQFARLALSCVRKEFPNKPDHVVRDAADVHAPRVQHPAFYGCFDWHSCVHGHWLLVRLLKQFPELPEAKDIRAALDENLAPEKIKGELEYLEGPERKTFERTYGWAWLLKLEAELHSLDSADGARWFANLKLLADAFVTRYLEFLPNQTYPIRTGVHPNTAFGIAFALDYALATKNTKLSGFLIRRARDYFLKDKDYPAAWEPSGEDFFSPALMEADLMRRALSKDEFPAWFHGFLPSLPQNLLNPATVTDRTDPKLVHLDGLNLSRAWAMRSIAAALPPKDPTRRILADSADRHARDALANVASGHYEGEHWLATFAVYMLSTPRP